MKKVLVEYHSNNSGGSDWLNDKNWSDLNEAGWKLFGHGDFAYNEEGNNQYGEDGLPKRRGSHKEPKYAYKYFTSLEEGIKEFEEITGEDSESEGCPCCGQPHNFSIERVIND